MPAFYLTITDAAIIRVTSTTCLEERPRVRVYIRQGCIIVHTATARACMDMMRVGCLLHMRVVGYLALA